MKKTKSLSRTLKRTPKKKNRSPRKKTLKKSQSKPQSTAPGMRAAPDVEHFMMYLFVSSDKGVPIFSHDK